MLLGPDARAPARTGRSAASRALGGGLFAVTCLLGTISLVRHLDRPQGLGGHALDHGSVEAVGRAIFGPAIFAFELVTALLIVAVIGAIAVARGRQGALKKKAEVRAPRDMFAGAPRPRPTPRPLGPEGAE